MSALYAFLRMADDLSDSPASVAGPDAVQNLREAVRAAFEGSFPHMILPALVDTCRRYDVPLASLEAMLDGVEMDFSINRYDTFADLKVYCHRVASMVGQACVRIWGFSHADALAAADDCGIAFQLTNILRDLQEDAARGRIYLPQEDLARFDCNDQDLLYYENASENVRVHVRRLILFEVERTAEFYAAGQRLTKYLSADGRRAFRTMFATYWSLLDQIRRQDGDVFSVRPAVGFWRRTRILAATFLPLGNLHASDELAGARSA
jgi:phytoene synthase